ncbi:protein TolQ [Aquibaculum arenosum]|uniref:Tol-Pal system protein TolQ n=1 Tax=Aquibaculum arenosum TaxID=3032591 RepID=A0ABT5YIJ6_9PROT|nr:protein TolQ [Fodinicurvata sp. CAU 1616]MDF2094718.1 protein TolQ [Fodinicurvata sp. CAU 1616]
METAAVDAAQLAGDAGGMTIWSLFLQADLVVKAVMFILIGASIWSWTIIFEKSARLRRLRRHAEQFEEAFWSGQPLDELYDEIGAEPQGPFEAVFSAAMREWRRFARRGSTIDDESVLSLRERADRVMGITIGREMDLLEKQMIFLASVGSSAPFIGLFGTVWGIMNSFASIAATANTSLAVVAPGIAEALFATALGLVAAIPATIGFNKLNNDIGRYGQRLEAFANEFSAILSRQLEEAR